MKPFLLFFLSFTLAMAWRYNAIICTSQAIAKWLTCHDAPASVSPNKLSPLSTVSDSLTLHPGRSWRESCIQAMCKERHTGKHNQNKTACVVFRPLNFTGLQGCTRRPSWFKMSSLRQVPISLVRNKCKWGYDQVPLLHSWKYYRICC